MRPEPRRKLIGRAASVFERVRVYRTEEALEVDYATSFEVTRRRLFFDEIVLVLLHRRRIGPIVKAIGLVLFAGGLAAAFSRATLFLVPVGFLFGFLLVFGLSSWTVTAYGRRTVARMRYGLRKEKARSVYTELCRRTAEAQGAATARGAAEESAVPQAPRDEPWPAPPPAAGPEMAPNAPPPSEMPAAAEGE